MFATAFGAVLGSPATALAAGRAASKEPLSQTGGNTALIVVLVLAAAAIIAAVVVLVRRKKAVDSPAVVLSPPAPPKPKGATLEAQGTFLGGKHFGIVSHATIGRSGSADIRVEDPMVSGSHCLLSWENGALFLMDLDSTNGTFVAGTGKLPPKKQVQLQNGSTFWLGNEKLSFRVKIK